MKSLSDKTAGWGLLMIPAKNNLHDEPYYNHVSGGDVVVYTTYLEADRARREILESRMYPAEEHYHAVDVVWVPKGTNQPSINEIRQEKVIEGFVQDIKDVAEDRERLLRIHKKASALIEMLSEIKKPSWPNPKIKNAHHDLQKEIENYDLGITQ